MNGRETFFCKSFKGLYNVYVISYKNNNCTKFPQHWISQHGKLKDLGKSFIPLPCLLQGHTKMPYILFQRKRTGDRWEELFVSHLDG